MQARALLPLVSLLSAVLAGCSGGEPEGPAWTEVTVPASHMLDLEYALASGTPLSWTWESDRTVAFQALYVEGAATYPLASSFGVEGQGERTTPREGRYDLVWDNRGGSDISVRFIVREGYVQTTWPPGQGPGCAPPPALLERMC